MILSGVPIGDRPKNHEGIMGCNQQPWLVIESIDFLEKNISSNHIGFEFGSGSSTFWFSKISKKIYSVESDQDWYNNVLEKIKENSIENIDASCIKCEMLPIWDKDTEIGDEYDDYSKKIIDSGIDFDYVLVDGVARSLCILSSIKKIKPGGFLIIDNSERPAYWEAMSQIPKDWIINVFKNDVDTTTIFQRPLNFF